MKKSTKAFVKTMVTASVKGSANTVSTCLMYQPKKPEGLSKFVKTSK